jgi:hypothetical protein
MIKVTACSEDTLSYLSWIYSTLQHQKVIRSPNVFLNQEEGLPLRILIFCYKYVGRYNKK